MIDNKETRKDPKRAIIATKVCPYCHKKFTYNKQISRRKKFCSYECTRRWSDKQYLHKEHYQYKKKKPICKRCNKQFDGHGGAKYCPDCLRWLALNSSTARERNSYASDFLYRKDCQGLPPIHQTYLNVTVFGKTYPNKKTLCEAFGIKYTQLRYRILQGYSLENAIKYIQSHHADVIVHNKQFKNKNELCKYYSINYSQLKYYLKKGYSIEKAVNYLSKEV